MKNRVKYAFSKWLSWFGILATIIGVIAIFPICRSMALVVIISCFALAFIIPFIGSFFKNNFKMKTVGKSSITFAFGDLFDEECFVVTTNRYFDVNPTGEYIAADSLLGKFVNKYFHDNVAELEEMIKGKVPKDANDNIVPSEYGESIKLLINGQIVYLLAFTDRNKSDQPEDFYIRTVQKFLKMVVNENHGKTIGVPLLGDNNNLSDSGFSDSEMSFGSLMAMINNFEIINQRSELKLKIVALPEKRSELIEVVSSYSK